MTPQQIVGTVLRAIAIWLVMRGFVIFVQAIGAGGIYQGELLRTSFMIWSVAYVLVALVLWFLPMWLAHKLIPKTSHDNKLDVPVVEAARVACCAIGLWFLLQSIQSMAWLLVSAFVVRGTESVFSAMSADNKVQAASDLIMIVISLALITKSRFFVRLALASDDTK